MSDQINDHDKIISEFKANKAKIRKSYTWAGQLRFILPSISVYMCLWAIANYCFDFGITGFFSFAFAFPVLLFVLNMIYKVRRPGLNSEMDILTYCLIKDLHQAGYFNTELAFEKLLETNVIINIESNKRSLEYIKILEDYNKSKSAVDKIVNSEKYKEVKFEDVCSSALDIAFVKTQNYGLRLISDLGEPASLTIISQIEESDEVFEKCKKVLSGSLKPGFQISRAYAVTYSEPGCYRRSLITPEKILEEFLGYSKEKAA